MKQNLMPIKSCSRQASCSHWILGTEDVFQVDMLSGFTLTRDTIFFHDTLPHALETIQQQNYDLLKKLCVAVHPRSLRA